MSTAADSLSFVPCKQPLLTVDRYRVSPLGSRNSSHKDTKQKAVETKTLKEEGKKRRALTKENCQVRGGGKRGNKDFLKILLSWQVNEKGTKERERERKEKKKKIRAYNERKNERKRRNKEIGRNKIIDAKEKRKKEIKSKNKFKKQREKEKEKRKEKKE